MKDRRIKTMGSNIPKRLLSPERRFLPLSDEIELRVEDGVNGPTLSGYAARFNVWSEKMFGFREMVKPGAFKKTIKEADIRALINHNGDLILGRNKANTLELIENNLGLKYSVPLGQQSYALDLVESIKRGDITGNSFAFRTISDRWGTQDGEEIRELLEVQLFDVGPQTYPAYPQTSLSVRSLFELRGIDMEMLDGLALRAANGLALRAADLELINASIEALRSYLPVEEPPAKDPEDEPGDKTHSNETELWRLSIMKRQLDNKLKAASL